MSFKQDVKENEPSLEEWMAKIREKKLRPVAVNKEKEKAPAADKDRSKALQDANDLIKTRQGLRNVSAPKWPGANDNKAKTNTTILPQRAQLRSVSGRSIQTTPAAVLEDHPLDTPQCPEAISTEKVNTINNEADARIKSELRNTDAVPDDSVDEAAARSVDGDESDQQFPLDALNDNQEVSLGEDPTSLSVSSGATLPGSAVELKLPEKDEAFPLDVVDDKIDASAQEDQVPVPLLVSAGVYVLKDAENIELQLPTLKNEDFPLDSFVATEPGDENQDSTAISNVAVSSGVFDTAKSTAEIALPEKQKPSDDENTEEQIAEVKAAQREAMGDDAEETKDSILPSGGVIDINSSESITDILAKSSLLQSEDHLIVAEVDHTAVSEPKEQASEQEGLKCSQCSAMVPFNTLPDHVCSKGTQE